MVMQDISVLLPPLHERSDAEMGRDMLQAISSFLQQWAGNQKPLR